MNHVVSGEIPSKDLFMMCQDVNTAAFRDMPQGFHIRTCRRDELEIWKQMHLDFPHSPEQHVEYMRFMDLCYENMYRKNENLFYEKSLFVCNEYDVPVGRGFIWKVYNRINSIQWYKVLREYEGRGIGRALLTVLMKNLKKNDYPIYLHTHPSSFRAIKLYSDFGFSFVSDPIIGFRNNDLYECLPILEKYIPEKDFRNLKITRATNELLEAASSSKTLEL